MEHNIVIGIDSKKFKIDLERLYKLLKKNECIINQTTAGAITQINTMADIILRMETIIIMEAVIMEIHPPIDTILTDSSLKGDIITVKGTNRMDAWMNVSLAWQQCVVVA